MTSIAQSDETVQTCVQTKEYILVIERTAPPPPASPKDVPTQPLPALSVVYSR